MSVARLSETAAQAIVQRAAQATGADFSFLLRTAARESGLAPEAKAGTSSAAGLFQFIEGTWLRLVERYGEKHGLPGAAGLGPGGADKLPPRQRQALLDLRFDPQTAATLAGELTKENAAILQGELGRPPQPGELYAAHVLGPAGAARLIKAAEAGAPSAAALFPRAAEANRPLFFDAAGRPRDAQALLARLSEAGPGEAVAPRAAPAVREESVEPPAAIGLLWAALLGQPLEPEPHEEAQRRARQAYASRAGTADNLS